MENMTINPWASFKHKWEGLDTEKQALNQNEDKIVRMQRKVHLSKASHGAHVAQCIVGFSIGGAILIGAIISAVAAPLFVAIALFVAAAVCLIPATAIFADSEINYNNETKTTNEITTLTSRYNTLLTDYKSRRAALRQEIVAQENTERASAQTEAEAIAQALQQTEIIPGNETAQDQPPGEDCITLQTMERATIQEEMNRLNELQTYKQHITALTDNRDCAHCSSMTFSTIGYVAGGILLLAAVICLAVSPFLIALPVLIAAMITLAASSVLMGDTFVKHNLKYSTPPDGVYTFPDTWQSVFNECREADTALTHRIVQTKRAQRNLADAKWTLEDHTRKMAAYTKLMSAQIEGE